VDCLVEEVVKEEVLEVGIGTVSNELSVQIVDLRLRILRLGDVLEENRSNNTAAAPHECNLRLVELPVVLLGSILDQHEPLSIRDDLGGVESLLKVVNESLTITSEAGAWPIQ